MISEVFDQIMLGAWEDGLHWPGPSLCVLEPEAVPREYAFDRSELAGFRRVLPEECAWVPIVRRSPAPPYVVAVPAQLRAASHVIDGLTRSASDRLLIFCGAGLERAPLTLAWYLVRRCSYTWDEAYALIGKKRQVADRREWIPERAR